MLIDSTTRGHIECLLTESNRILNNWFHRFLSVSECPKSKYILFTFKENECLKIRDIRDDKYLTDTKQFTYDFCNNGNILSLCTHRGDASSSNRVHIYQRASIDGEEPDSLTTLFNDEDVQNHILEKVQIWLEYAKERNIEFEQQLQKEVQEKEQKAEERHQKIKEKFLSI